MENQKFKNPSPEFRGKPFWVWNGKLEKDEMMRQIDVIKEMGFGGFFIHPRTGLETEYLGDEWMTLVRACALKAKELGMETWLYDEDRWPSGTAGGAVTKNPAFRLKFLQMTRLPKADFDFKNYGQEFIAAFAAKIDIENRLSDYYKITDELQIKDGYEVLVYVMEEQAKQDVYNGYTYLDTLNKDATFEFLRLTHEKYKNSPALGGMLGKEITGIFTDEPHRGCIFGGFALQNKNAGSMMPYTYKLFAVFKDKFDYDLSNVLPEICHFKTGADFSKVSYDYVEILQEMFLDNFAKPCYEWCAENHILLTGHILHEDTLSCQVSVSGSVQRYYEYMDYPGIDVLTEGNRCFWVAKQVSSVAKQLGKPFIVSELYGATGWQMGFEGHKQVGDWQAVLGINLRCHHLSWYTMKGETKRDYPASIFFQSSWYQNYKYVEDYFSRFGYILSAGEAVTDTLVINAVESVWGKVRLGCFNGIASGAADIDAIENEYTELFNELTDGGVDFDYADEDILARHGAASGDTLRIGKMNYKTVVVSGMLTIRKTTLNILRRFAKNGGKVVFNGIPRYVDGIKQKIRTDDFVSADGFHAVAEFCRKNSAIKLPKIKNVLSNIRKDGKEYYLALVNTDRANGTGDTEIKINLPLNAEELSLRDGEVIACSFKRAGDGVTITTRFDKGQERVFRLTPQSVKQYEPPRKAVREIVLSPALPYKLDEDNVLVLDFADYTIGQDAIKNDEILKIDGFARDRLGLSRRGGEMMQPWYIEKYGKGTLHKKTTPVKTTFKFNIEQLPQSAELCLESPDKFEITINGKPLKKRVNGNYIDNSIFRLSLPKNVLVIGENTVTLLCSFDGSFGLEACYLVGNFGVRLNNEKATVTALPETLDHRPLRLQGLPFYGGKIKFFTGVKNEKVSVKFDGIRGACYEVDFGCKTEIIAFAPYESGTHDADGELTLTLNLTRRNTFGPLHITKDYGFTAPDMYVFEGDAFSREYFLIDEGLNFPKVFCHRA
ncbi:hypothetical protein FACS1894211_01090 [Clostridia bacterium]|nr:hypothetical protein FACS1894211_01090 [Clostridia bacterium]